jgi:hypothetical protein
MVKNLGIADGRLDRRRTFLGHMAQIIRDFFETPTSLPCPMSKIMTEVMEGQISDMVPLVFGGPRFQVTEPVMDPFLGLPRASLREKYICSLRIARGLQVLIEGFARFVHQIDLAPFAAFMTHPQPAHLRPDMRMSHFEKGYITHLTARPIAQGNKGRSSSIICLFHQRTKDKALIFRQLLVTLGC